MTESFTVCLDNTEYLPPFMLTKSTVAESANITIYYFLDFALLKIDKPFYGHNIQALSIDNIWKKEIKEIRNYLIGRSVTISGWGKTETGRNSEVLLKQIVTVQDVEEDAKLILSHPMGYGAGGGDSGGSFSFINISHFFYKMCTRGLRLYKCRTLPQLSIIYNIYRKILSKYASKQ